MDITAYMERYDDEDLVVCQERAVGLKAFIAIHDTTLGPAAAGTRVWSYGSESDAIEDALRLARGMTYKYAEVGARALAPRPEERPSRRLLKRQRPRNHRGPSTLAGVL